MTRFEESIRDIDDAKKTVEETRSQLVLMRDYVNTRIDKITKFQNSIPQNLIHVKGSTGNLRQLTTNEMTSFA